MSKILDTLREFDQAMDQTRPALSYDIRSLWAQPIIAAYNSGEDIRNNPTKYATAEVEAYKAICDLFGLLTDGNSISTGDYSHKSIKALLAMIDGKS
jgi:hypothetical protein